MFDFVIIIPARLKSTRLPNKPLINIEGKPMIRRTFERAVIASNIENVFIATDSIEIKQECIKFTDNIILTPESCKTGTDRLAVASNLVNSKIYINLQGDEPIMPIENIKKIISVSINDSTKIYNGYAKILNQSEFFNNSIPKLVTDNKGNMLYISRAPIPNNKNNFFISANKQICLYAYNKKLLNEFHSNKKTSNEEIEDIEILRFLEFGFDVKMIEMNPNTIAVDTAQDLKKVKQIIQSQGEDVDTYRI